MVEQPDLVLRVTENWRRPTIEIAGDLDIATAPKLRACLREFTGEHVTLDFSDVTFLDSTGISVLVAAHKKTFLSGGSIVLHGVQPAQRRLMEITGLTGYLYFDGNGTAV